MDVPRCVLIFLFLVLGCTKYGSCSCSPGWDLYKDYCYHFSHDKTTWHEALSFCNAEEATLAFILSNDTDKFIDGIAQQHGHPYWVGGTDTIVEGSWEWISANAKFTYTHWKSGEPDGDTNENCLVINWENRHQWVDGDCSKHHRFICQKQSTFDQVIIG